MNNNSFLKRSGLVLALAAVLMGGTAVLSSCTGDVKTAVKNAKEAVEHASRDLRDSEKWGKVVTKTLSLGDFQQIDASGNADIFFTQSDSASVVVEGNEQVLSRYDITCADGTLHVSLTGSGGWGPMPFIRVRVTAPLLSSVKLNGVGDLLMEDTVTLDAPFAIELGSTGDAEIEHLRCTGLNVNITGTGDLEIHKAKCQTASLTTTGTGDIDVEKMTCEGDAKFSSTGTGDIDADLKCENLDVNLSGTGDAKIDVKCNHISANAAGTSNIELKGEAKSLTKTETGFSKVRSKKLSVESISY